MKKIALAAAIALCAASCSSPKKVISTTDTPSQPSPEATVATPYVQELATGTIGMVPKASAFRMSGDYADHVAVTLGADGQLTYYPAPTDLSAASEPVFIGDGWWLNRQGLGANSVFTKWTFSEYRALKQAPTPAEIKASIIPDAAVTEFRRLPITASQAANVSPASLLQYLE